MVFHYRKCYQLTLTGPVGFFHPYADTVGRGVSSGESELKSFLGLEHFNICLIFFFN